VVQEFCLHLFLICEIATIYYYLFTRCPQYNANDFCAELDFSIIYCEIKQSMVEV